MALGGHSIPLDRGALGVLVVLGSASEAEAHSGSVTGLERAIPKSKGQEFGALLHELGAEFVANPFSPPFRELLLSIAPDAKDRMPKRGVKKPEPEPEPPKKKGDAKHAPAAQTTAPPPAKKKETRTAEPPAKAAAASKKPAPAALPKKKVLPKPLAKRKPR